jgi:hypothetical protein
MQIAATPSRPLALNALPRLLLSAIALICGFAVAAYAAGLGPFDGIGGAPSARDAAMRALPFDAPVPDEEPAFAGTGKELPYRIEWTSDLPPQVADAYFAQLAGQRPKWAITLNRPNGAAYEITLVRASSDGLMTHFARMTIEPAAAGSRIIFDFIPMSELPGR